MPTESCLFLKNKLFFMQKFSIFYIRKKRNRKESIFLKKIKIFSLPVINPPLSGDITKRGGENPRSYIKNKQNRNKNHENSRN